MTTNRRIAQEAHEHFTVSTFLDEINRRHRASYRVVEKPNPPEALIQSKSKTSWVEVTSAYMNRAFAEEIWSNAISGGKPLPMSTEVIFGPDTQFAVNFAETVKKKL